MLAGLTQCDASEVNTMRSTKCSFACYCRSRLEQKTQDSFCCFVVSDLARTRRYPLLLDLSVFPIRVFVQVVVCVQLSAVGAWVRLCPWSE